MIKHISFISFYIWVPPVWWCALFLCCVQVLNKVITVYAALCSEVKKLKYEVSFFVCELLIATPPFFLSKLRVNLVNKFLPTFRVSRTHCKFNWLPRNQCVNVFFTLSNSFFLSSVFLSVFISYIFFFLLAFAGALLLTYVQKHMFRSVKLCDAIGRTVLSDC